MKIWKDTLGRPRSREAPVLTPQKQTPGRIIAHVERAAVRLPFSVKCLPRAIAVQWLMQLAGKRSTLVIAKANAPTGTDIYHAWVEMDEAILIGDCDRSAYIPLLVLTGRSTGPAHVISAIAGR